MPDRELAAGHFDGDGCTFPDPGHFAPDRDVVACPACKQGWHGEHCQEQFWTTGEPPAMVDCECTEGACRGEWVQLGSLDGDQVTAQTVSKAVDQLVQGAQKAAPAIGAALSRVGYAAAEAVTRMREAASSATPNGSADNESYVKSRLAGSLHHTAGRRAGLPSPTMSGLGKQQIIDHSLDAPGLRPGYVQIPEHLGGLPDDAPERHRDQPNRAERRRAARGRRRG